MPARRVHRRQAGVEGGSEGNGRRMDPMHMSLIMPVLTRLCGCDQLYPDRLLGSHWLGYELMWDTCEKPGSGRQVWEVAHQVKGGVP